jgi:3-deoxy-manno-octulosonate cytidylyltransferase (CMP-KDO synthetase)
LSVLEAFIATAQVLVLIPARYASTRFPGKPLIQLAGRSMIERVYSQCVNSTQNPDQNSYKLDVAVVTDNDKIESHVAGFGGVVHRVDDDVPSGTQRICLAWERFYKESQFDLIVNVQGDEPLYTADDLEKLISFHLNSSFDVATMVHRSEDDNEFENPNRVKVAWEETSGQCFYFSRAGIPYRRSPITKEWHQHVGVYSYRPKALKSFVSADASLYEQMEGLEQLRALSLGLSIGATTIDHELIGVDTPEDKERVEGVLS